MEELRAIAADVISVLAGSRTSLAVAESSTGGLIGHALTEVPGSSAVFLGGIVAYNNRLKALIGVPDAALREHGAVSREVAQAMAHAIRRWAGADIGLAETGIAGPGGGSAARPAGLFFVAVAGRAGAVSEHIMTRADRSSNKIACACAALGLLRRYAGSGE
jgi:PncC family amidohydrolase